MVDKKTYAFMAAAAYDERRGSANDAHTKAIEDYLETPNGGLWRNDAYQPATPSSGWNNADGASYSDPATGMQADVWTKGSECVVTSQSTEALGAGVPACITHAISRSTTILAAAIIHLGVISSAAHAETDLAECYGETLEVSIIARTPTDTDDGELILSLPNSKMWKFSRLREGHGPLIMDVPCQEEPVLISAALGGIPDERIGTFDFADPDRPPSIRERQRTPPNIRGRTRGFLIDGPLNLTSVEGGERMWLDVLLAEGVPVEDGFIRRVPVSPDHKANGSFLFPDSYLTPLGLPMIAHCLPKICYIQYRFTEQLQIRYDFWNSGEYSPDLIELDQVVREILNDWIVEAEE